MHVNSNRSAEGQAEARHNYQRGRVLGGKLFPADTLGWEEGLVAGRPSQRRITLGWMGASVTLNL